MLVYRSKSITNYQCFFYGDRDCKVSPQFSIFKARLLRCEEDAIEPKAKTDIRQNFPTAMYDIKRDDVATAFSMWGFRALKIG